MNISSRNMLLNLNINISGNFAVKYNCDISKPKLVFPLPNESYSSLIASVVSKLLWIKPEYFFWDTRYIYYELSESTRFSIVSYLLF